MAAEHSILIRDYRQTDAAALTRLFFESVHRVGARDYSAAQLDAWAPAIPDPDLWHRRMSARLTLVAEAEGEVLAFAELERHGHIDMFYCRADRVRRGIGRALYESLEAQARRWDLPRLWTEASLTERPFFAGVGFRVLRRRRIQRRGIMLVNFAMEKLLAGT